MTWVQAVLEVLKAIPNLIKLWREWELAKLRRIQEEEAQRRKQEIEDGLKQSDTEKIENAIGSGNAGLPAKDQTGVQVRPAKERK